MMLNHPEAELTQQVTDILIDGGCTINKPAVKKLVDLMYQLQLAHIDGFAHLVKVKTNAAREVLEHNRKDEAER